ncbi:TPA: lipoteichoic acid stability factor AuxB [Staphylococcus pseudintermedius]
MAGETYTHISRPVNRLAEKILGWLSWLLLLGTTVVAMFFGLVLFSNESSIQSLENSIANNATLQELLTNNNMNATQFVIMLQNGVWAFIVYLIICLLISFLALISMNHRIVSGLLFLLVAIVTLPLFFILVPLFFFIIALMMFIRKEKYEAVPTYYTDGYSYEPYATNEPQDYQQHETYREPVAYPENERPSTESYRTYEETPAYESSAVSDDEPEVLSRSAKYHQKSQKYQEVSQADEADDTLVYDSRAMSRNVEQRQQDDDLSTDTDEENEVASMSRAEMKQQRKEEKKARKAYEKEQRKLRPSASSQRRQNYDDRMKLQQDRSKSNSQVDKDKDQ